MPMASLLLAPLVLAAVLILSGVAKLRQPDAAASAFSSLRMPKAIDRPLFHKALSVGELVLAAGLLLAPGWGQVVFAVLALALMGIYVAVIARALGFGYPVDCGCFGRLGMGEVTKLTLVRNILLTLVAVAAVVFGVAAGASPLWALLTGGATTWGWVLGAAVTAALAVLILQRRSGPVAERQYPETDEEGEYVRTPTPPAAVLFADGRPRNIRDLARTQAQLLVWLSPGCGSCQLVMSKLDELREQVAPVALREVFSMRPEQAEELVSKTKHMSIEHAVFDPDRLLGASLQMSGAPSAVLLGTDDMLAGGPVVGATSTLEFINDVISQLHEESGSHPS